MALNQGNPYKIVAKLLLGFDNEQINHDRFTPNLCKKIYAATSSQADLTKRKIWAKELYENPDKLAETLSNKTGTQSRNQTQIQTPTYRHDPPPPYPELPPDITRFGDSVPFDSRHLTSATRFPQGPYLSNSKYTLSNLKTFIFVTSIIL